MLSLKLSTAISILTATVMGPETDLPLCPLPSTLTDEDISRLTNHDVAIAYDTALCRWFIIPTIHSSVYPYSIAFINLNASRKVQDATPGLVILLGAKDLVVRDGVQYVVFSGWNVPSVVPLHTGGDLRLFACEFCIAANGIADPIVAFIAKLPLPIARYALHLYQQYVIIPSPLSLSLPTMQRGRCIFHCGASVIP